MEGAVAVQRREDAELHDQRPEGLLPLLLVGQARRHLHLRHGDGGRLVPGGGRAACGRGRGSAAGDLARGERGREPPQIAARGDGARRRLFRGAAPWAGRRRGARLSCPPRAFRRHPAPLPHRLRDARALCAPRPPRGEGRRGRGHGRARAPGLGRGRVGALRPLPRPGHVPDRRRARAHRRLRRARHERRRRRRNTSTRRTRRSSTRAGCSTTCTRRAARRTSAARSSPSRAMSTSSR